MVSNKKYKKALQDLLRYKYENEKLSEQVVEYKQKYLDEQQKRLELAELVERMESIKVCDVEVDFDDGKV